MMKSILCLLLFLSFAQARTNLLLVGGGHRPAEAMKEFGHITLEELKLFLIKFSQKI